MKIQILRFAVGRQPVHGHFIGEPNGLPRFEQFGTKKALSAREILIPHTSIRRESAPYGPSLPGQPQCARTEWSVTGISHTVQFIVINFHANRQ